MESGEAEAALRMAVYYLEQTDGGTKARLWYSVADQLGDKRGRIGLKALDEWDKNSKR